jgi:hypothetical protein
MVQSYTVYHVRNGTTDRNGKKAENPKTQSNVCGNLANNTDSISCQRGESLLLG